MWLVFVRKGPKLSDDSNRVSLVMLMRWLLHPTQGWPLVVNRTQSHAGFPDRRTLTQQPVAPSVTSAE